MVVAVREQVQVLFLQGICMYVAIGEEKLTIWEYLLYMVYMIPLSLSSPLLSSPSSTLLNICWGIYLTLIGVK